MAETRTPSKLRLAVHDLKNAGGDGSARSIALGIFIVTALCGAAFGGIIYLAKNPQILSAMGIR